MMAKTPCGIPETDRILNAQLVLKCPQWRGRVVGPVLRSMLKPSTAKSRSTHWRRLLQVHSVVNVFQPNAEREAPQALPVRPSCTEQVHDI